MPKLLPKGGSLLAICTCLLLFSGPGCRKYANNPIDFEAWGFHKESYEMDPNDSMTVVYPIVNEEDGPAEISSVQIQCEEPGISITWSQMENFDANKVRVVFRTKNAPPGSYPLRITFLNQSGSFIERIATIHVVSYVDIILKNSAIFGVRDTVMPAPFDAAKNQTDYYSENYTSAIYHKSGTPRNQFYFTRLGYQRSVNPFPDIAVELDTLTGIFKAAQPIPGVTEYSGEGRIRHSDNERKMSGYYRYSYRSNGGYLYEGSLSF